MIENIVHHIEECNGIVVVYNSVDNPETWTLFFFREASLSENNNDYIGNFKGFIEKVNAVELASYLENKKRELGLDRTLDIASDTELIYQHKNLLETLVILHGVSKKVSSFSSNITNKNYYVNFVANQ